MADLRNRLGATLPEWWKVTGEARMEEGDMLEMEKRPFISATGLVWSLKRSTYAVEG
jgi:hypothetical protein